MEISDRLNDIFRIDLINDDKLIVSSMQTDDLDGGSVKSHIRELRMSYLLDDKSDEEKSDISKKISYLENIDISDSNDAKQLSIKLVNYELKMDNTIQSEIRSKSDHSFNIDHINDCIEKVIIDKYRELSFMNRIHLEIFHKIKPSIISSTDDLRIFSRINLACDLIMYHNRKKRGDLLIINPLLYNRFKHHFDLLKMGIFLSNHIPKSEILVSVKKHETHRFIQFICNYLYTEIVDPKFETKEMFYLNYGIGNVTNNPELNCFMITIT